MLADVESDGESDCGSTASSEYVAPLSGHAPDPSIDGTSVSGGEGGVRAEKEADVGEEEKQVSHPVRALVARLRGPAGAGYGRLGRVRGS